MKLLLAATIVLMLSAIAMAAPESIQLGTYAVSFDLNTDIAYQIQTPEPMESPIATIYPLLIITDNSTGASITITEYKELQDSNLGLNKEIAALRLVLYRGINVTEQKEMDIDGNSGFILSGMPIPGANIPEVTYYHASYWLDSKDCSECGPVSVATTNVGISSTYPQDVTEGLLSSLRVVKGEAMAPAQSAPMAQGGQVLPPA
jgi:hypothetical protein